MIIEKGASDHQFQMKDISFGQLKTLRDACAAYAKQGSAAADAIASEIRKFLDQSTI